MVSTRWNKLWSFTEKNKYPLCIYEPNESHSFIQLQVKWSNEPFKLLWQSYSANRHRPPYKGKGHVLLRPILICIYTNYKYYGMNCRSCVRFCLWIRERTPSWEGNKKSVFRQAKTDQHSKQRNLQLLKTASKKIILLIEIISPRKHNTMNKWKKEDTPDLFQTYLDLHIYQLQLLLVRKICHSFDSDR